MFQVLEEVSNMTENLDEKEVKEKQNEALLRCYLQKTELFDHIETVLQCSDSLLH